MYFRHADDVWQQFPELVAGALYVDGIHTGVDVSGHVSPWHARARERLATATEGEFPEIQAWRRAFSRMGLKPTQYRCASESLLRRFRKDGFLPTIHPLIDLCNAASLAFAIPVAVFDVDHVAGFIEVRHATGDESYQTFSGEVEHPTPDEVIFADAAGMAHARRWTNRQSGLSAIRDDTTRALLVAEAMHESAQEDMPRLMESLATGIGDVWGTLPKHTILTTETRCFEFGAHSA